MYHHQGKHGFSAETSVPPDRHLLVPGMNVHGEMGLVLSTDAKPRLKWTSELHQRFVEAVDQLGGAEKATPKAVMKLMAIPGLTLYHLKSHLQKYRLSKSMHGQADKSNNKNGCITTADGMPEGRATFTNDSGRASPTNKGLQMGEALQMQIEVQKRLHEQLEVQRHLQLRIEAQGKYIQSVLEKAEETLGIKNLGPEELKAAKLQNSELAPKASNECLDPDLLELKRTPCLGIPQTQAKQTTDCSIDSCLTSCEGSQKEQEIYNIGDTPVCRKEESSRPEETELAWCTDSIKSRMLLSGMFPIQRTTSNLSTGGVHGKRGNRSTTYEARWKERDAEEGSHEPSKTKRHATPLGNEKPAKEFRFQDLTVQLDLNAEDKNDAASSSKDFDLNGFNWN